MAAGADVSRVFIVRSVFSGDGSRRTFNLQVDLQRLEDEIHRKGGARLVIIDPVTSYLGRGVDSHKNSEVRSVLEPLGEMAQRLKVAVICNNHFSKGSGGANSKIIGSVGFVNHARSAYIVTPDAEDADRMFLVPSKSNIGPKKDGLAYRIEGCLIDEGGVGIPTSRIAWESDPVTISADAALAAHLGGDEARTAKQEAIDFLQSELSDGLAHPVKDVQQAARAAGVAPKALRSAREALRIRPEKSGFDGGWTWALPKMPNMPEGAQPQTLGTFGHLRDPRASSEQNGTDTGMALDEFDGVPVFLPRRNGGVT
jgi:putative DNA primase/helicase